MTIHQSSEKVTDIHFIFDFLLVFYLIIIMCVHTCGSHLSNADKAFHGNAENAAVNNIYVAAQLNITMISVGWLIRP